MKKTLLEIYALAVCFVATSVLVTCLCNGTYSLIKLMDPELTLNAQLYRQYVNNEEFCSRGAGLTGCFKDKERSQRLPEDAITQRRENAYAAEVVAEQRTGRVELIGDAIYAPVALIVFLIHWRMARNARDMQPLPPKKVGIPNARR